MFLAFHARASLPQNNWEILLFKNLRTPMEIIDFQLLQLMPELQAPEGLQLGTSDSSENLLKIIGFPCVSCSPDLPEHHPDQDH